MRMKFGSKPRFLAGQCLTGAVLLACVGSLPAQSVLQGLAAYLNFDNNIDAQAGTTHNGAIYAQSADPSAKYVAGIAGQAVSFGNDGSSGQPSDWAITLGNLESIYSNNFSYSLWVQTSSTVDASLFGNKDWTSGGNVGWCFNTSSGKNLNWNAAGGSRRDINLNPPFSDGNWHLTTVTWNRTANVVSVYLDGVLQVTSDISPNGSASMNAGFPTLVGASGSGKYCSTGSIDELGIWTRVLAPEEIAAVYARGRNGVPLVKSSAPFFAQPPAGGTRYASDSFELECVLADDRGPVTYQWLEGGNPVAGATNTSLLLTNLTAGSFSYTVAANDGVGSITSAPAVLTVLSSSAITDGLEVYLNFETNILAQAGTTNNGTAIGSDPTEKYTTGIVGRYAAIFNNDGSGGTSTDWAVSLGDIEWIYGGSWAFSLWVNATNANDGAIIGNKDWTSGGDVGWELDPSRVDALNYNTVGNTRRDIGTTGIIDGKWHHVAVLFDREANLVSYYVDGSLSASESLSTLGTESLTPTTFSPNATLVGSSGNDTWSAQGAVDDLGIWYRTLRPEEIVAIYAQGLKGQPLTTAVAASTVKPFITAQPQSLTLVAGFSAAFSVTASGAAPLAYQWYQNGALLLGQTNSTLPLAFVTLANAGSYAVVVSNVAGTVTSTPPAVLTVTPAAASLTNGLVVYLDFETNLLGKAGTTNNGMAIGTAGVETYTNGVVGSYAASFNNDGSSSAAPSDWAVSLGDLEWIYAGSWSFSIWVKTTDTLGAFLGNKDWSSGGNIGWLISEYYSQFLNYKAVNSPRHDIGPATSWADDNWHHIAGVFYRDVNTVYAYVDGALTAQAPLSATGYESLTPTDINITLVGSSGNGAYSSDGQIDDLGIWTRPMSQAEVVGIYQAGVGGKAIPEARTGAPTLSVAVSPDGITITYPAWASGFTLQSSAAISPAAWMAVKSAPVIAGTNATVTVPLAHASRFFRLQN